MGQYESALKHWGIPGQQWGVRRWQNEDGTFNEAGKLRYFGKAAKDLYDYHQSRGYTLTSDPGTRKASIMAGTNYEKYREKLSQNSKKDPLYSKAVKELLNEVNKTWNDDTFKHLVKTNLDMKRYIKEGEEYYKNLNSEMSSRYISYVLNDMMKNDYKVDERGKYTISSNGKRVKL